MNRAKQKGTAFETAVVTFLSEKFPGVERRTLSGASDKGDVAGLAGWVLELKNYKTFNLSGWVEEARKEAANASVDWWAVVAKRPNKNVSESYVVLPLWMFRNLLERLN